MIYYYYSQPIGNTELFLFFILFYFIFACLFSYELLCLEIDFILGLFCKA